MYTSLSAFFFIKLSNFCIVVIIILLVITAFYIYEVNKKVLYIGKKVFYTSHGKLKKGIITEMSNSHVFIGGLRIKKTELLIKL